MEHVAIDPMWDAPPRERLITMPRELPEKTLGLAAAAWMIDNLKQPNGARAGEAFTPTPQQIEFLMHLYALNPDGSWVYNWAVRRLSKGSGKLVTHVTPVLTVDGWSTHGQLKVGDRIYSASGRPTTVIKLHEERDDYDLWDVHFSDGVTETFSGGHLFVVDEFVGKSKRRRVTKSVVDMLDSGLMFKRPLSPSSKCTRPDVTKYALPPQPVLEMPERDLPMDPYVLGYWLGDGSSRCNSIACWDEDEEHVSAALQAAGYLTSVTVDHGRTLCVRFGHERRHGKLYGGAADLGSARVLGRKHIPDIYLYASAEQRLALAQGLLDSDGYVAKSGSAEWCTVRKEMAYQAAQLLRSLGVRVNVKESDAKLYGRVTGKRYRLVFKPYKHQRLFTLPRKAERVKEQKRKPQPITIRSITRAPDQLGRCISVDGDGTYLVGETLKPTHNSPFAAALSMFELLGPCRFDRWDDASPFGVEGKTMPMAWIQVVATSEQQTKNTMRMVRAFAAKGSQLSKRYGLTVGKTFLDSASGDQLEQKASSSRSIEGGETSFTVCDELEHWVPSNGGPELMNTIEQNAAKTGARTLHTCNAWVPGESSAAESTFEDWVLQEEGRSRNTKKILYDARIAPPNAALVDDPPEHQIPLQQALEFVYEGCPWVDLEATKALIWSPRYTESRSYRFFLNRPSAADNAWVPLEEWTLLRDTGRVVRKNDGDEPGEEIVMFFDGSRSNDHTALVGCCMSDGHVFKLGHWGPDKASGTINVHKVDSAIRRVFDEYNVVAFWADVREWESFTRTTWPDEYGDRLILPAVRGQGMSASLVAWDMRSHAYQFAEAAETAYDEIQQKAFTHDGSADLGEHVSNCRVNEYKGRFSVKKESPKSPKKIDLAVCMIGARMLYRAVLSSKEWAERNKPVGQWRSYL